MLYNPRNPGARAPLERTREAARKLALEIEPIDVGRPDPFGDAARAAAGAVLVLSQASTLNPDRDVGSSAVKYRLPTIFTDKAFVTSGGLMSYGPDLADVYRQAAVHVDRILKGASPGDLPVEAPTKPLIFTLRDQLIELASRHRLPALFLEKSFVQAGGLLAYGPDRAAIFRRAAEYVAKVVEGAAPGDLPVQQPTVFEMALNLKTARTLGLQLPATLLARVDEVIE